MEPAPQMHPGFLLHPPSFYATVGIIVCWNQLTVGYIHQASGKMLQPCLHFATTDDEKCYNGQFYLLEPVNCRSYIHGVRAARAGSIHGERGGGEVASMASAGGGAASRGWETH